jgi:hypothetical protein
MKKLFALAIIMSLVTGVTMAQTHPAKKHATAKAEVKKDTIPGDSTSVKKSKHKAYHHKKTTTTTNKKS